MNIDEEERKKSECDVIRQKEAGDTDPTVIRDITVNISFFNIQNSQGQKEKRLRRNIRRHGSNSYKRYNCQHILPWDIEQLPDS